MEAVNGVGGIPRRPGFNGARGACTNQIGRHYLRCRLREAEPEWRLQIDFHVFTGTSGWEQCRSSSADSGRVWRRRNGASSKTGLKIRPLQDGQCILPGENGPTPGGERIPVCGAPRAGGNGVKRTLDVIGVTTGALSEILTLMSGRPVIDSTGVGGRLDALHLEYTPDDAAGT
jgi:hypothetical protein